MITDILHQVCYWGHPKLHEELPKLNRYFQDSFVEGAKLGQQGRRCQELQINIPWVISLRAVSEEVNFHQHTYF
jgi:hypothetical protein